MDPVADAAPVETADQPEVTAAPPEQGTSAEAVESFTDVDPTEKPAEGEVTPEWLQERYKQMQADYTRKRQAEAETAKERAEELEFLESLRSDRETQQAVYEQLLEILAESEEESEEEGDEPSELEQTVRQLQQAEDERQAASLAKNVVSHIEQLAKDAKVELDESELSELFNSAIAGEEVNSAGTEAAFKAWTARRAAMHDKWQKAYLASKEAPTPLPNGQSATDKPDLSDRDVRISRFAAILEGRAT